MNRMAVHIPLTAVTVSLPYGLWVLPYLQEILDKI